MARKTRRKPGIEKTKEPKGSKNQRILILVVMVTMLFSGLYMFGDDDEPPALPEPAQPTIVKYDVNYVGNQSILLKITGMKSEIVAVPKHRSLIENDLTSIAAVLNASLPGVLQSQYEVSNLFSFFRFIVSDTETAEKSISTRLRRVPGDFILFGSYTASYLTGTGGVNSVEVVGSLDLTSGDLVKSTLMQRTGDTGQALLGFVLNRVAQGTSFSVPVLDIIAYRVVGKSGDVIDVDAFSRALPGAVSVQYNPPVFTVDGVVNETLFGFEVNVDVSGNVSQVSSQEPVAGVSSVLDSLGFNYSMEPAVIVFGFALNESLDAAVRLVKGLNITGVETTKYGFVELPMETAIDNKIVGIEGYERFPATLNLGTGVNDTVNVGLTLMRFQGRLIPIAASEVEEPAEAGD